MEGDLTMKEILYALSNYLYEIEMELLPYNNSPWEEKKVEYRKGTDPNNIILIIPQVDYNRVYEHLKSYYFIKPYHSLIPECGMNKRCVIVTKK